MESDSDDVLELFEVNEVEDDSNPEENNQNESKDTDLTDTDELVYDRQIRLWGLQAQKKIMSSKVLFLGKNGIQEECMKNLLLAGIGMNITLANDFVVSEQDAKLSFFLKEEDVGKPHSVALCKRMSKITMNKQLISGINSELLFEEGSMFKFNNPEVLKNFNVLCVSSVDYPLHKLAFINERCRELGIAFFASMSCGTYGYFFTDLNKHKVVETFSKKAESVTIEYRSLTSILKNPNFPKGCDPAIKSLMGLIFLFKACEHKEPSSQDLDQVILDYSLDRDILAEMVDMYGKEFPLTSSILGGYLALEVRKFVTRQHETIPNFCVFNMDNSAVATAMI